MANVSERQQLRRGTTLVEMAIVLIVLFLLTFGIIEYGWLFQKMGHITNAARQGARVAARPNATVSAVNNAVAAAMSLGNIPSSAYQVEITSNNAGVTDLSTISPGQPIEVRVIAQYSDPGDGSGIGINVPIIPVPAQLRYKMVMVKEGP